MHLRISGSQYSSVFIFFFFFGYILPVCFAVFKGCNHEMIYACNIQVGELKAEKSIPDSILREAKGLAIITVMKVGMMLTYKIGTGLVVSRRSDGSWSPPSAISICGLGYGVQVIISSRKVVFLF
jgi:lipid-binding SYLF domain-containing protein